MFFGCSYLALSNDVGCQVFLVHKSVVFAPRIWNDSSTLFLMSNLYYSDTLLGESHIERRGSTGSVVRTPTHNTHLCSTVCSPARNAHHALGSSHTDRSVIFVRLKRICHLVCCTCLTFCCSLTCHLPRAPHLPHSLFLPPRHKNTQHNQNNMINSENTQYIMHISKLPQSTSCAIKNHSGVKTCRVAETRARQLPQQEELREDSRFCRGWWNMRGAFCPGARRVEKVGRQQKSLCCAILGESAGETDIFRNPCGLNHV